MCRFVFGVATVGEFNLDGLVVVDGRDGRRTTDDERLRARSDRFPRVLRAMGGETSGSSASGAKRPRWSENSVSWKRSESDAQDEKGDERVGSSVAEVRVFRTPESSPGSKGRGVWKSAGTRRGAATIPVTPESERLQTEGAGESIEKVTVTTSKSERSNDSLGVSYDDFIAAELDAEEDTAECRTAATTTTTMTEKAAERRRLRDRLNRGCVEGRTHGGFAVLDLLDALEELGVQPAEPRVVVYHSQSGTDEEANSLSRDAFVGSHQSAASVSRDVQ